MADINQFFAGSNQCIRYHQVTVQNGYHTSLIMNDCDQFADVNADTECLTMMLSSCMDGKSVFRRTVCAEVGSKYAGKLDREEGTSGVIRQCSDIGEMVKSRISLGVAVSSGSNSIL